MTVLDIDADFFFWPTIYDIWTDEEREQRIQKQTQTKTIYEVLDKFTIKNPENYKTFNDHDSLYHR